MMTTDNKAVSYSSVSEAEKDGADVRLIEERPNGYVVHYNGQELFYHDRATAVASAVRGGHRFYMKPWRPE